MRFILPLVALAAFASPALAGEQTVTVKIGYSDVDVTTAEGRATLEARIDAQLRQACKSTGASRYTFGRDLVDAKCVVEARAAALAEVERVAALQQRSGREVAAN